MFHCPLQFSEGNRWIAICAEKWPVLSNAENRSVSLTKLEFKSTSSHCLSTLNLTCVPSYIQQQGFIRMFCNSRRTGSSWGCFCYHFSICLSKIVTLYLYLCPTTANGQSSVCGEWGEEQRPTNATVLRDAERCKILSSNSGSRNLKKDAGNGAHSRMMKELNILNVSATWKGRKRREGKTPKDCFWEKKN